MSVFVCKSTSKILLSSNLMISCLAIFSCIGIGAKVGMDAGWHERKNEPVSIGWNQTKYPPKASENQ